MHNSNPDACVQVELHDRRGDPIPEGWGCDADGKLNTDPKKVLNGGGLVPIGGSEATGQKPADVTEVLTCCCLMFTFGHQALLFLLYTLKCCNNVSACILSLLPCR